MASHDILTIIENSPLSPEQKENFSQAIQENGLTPEVLEALKDALGHKQIEGLDNMGLSLDGADPALAQANETFKQEVTAAAEDFAAGMADIAKQVDTKMKSLTKDIEKVQAQMVTSAIEE